MSYFEFPNTRTYDSDLGWLIKTVKKITELVDGLEDWTIDHKEEYDQLKALYDALMAGNFPPSISEAFNKWMQKNALDLVGELVKMVFFEITDTGYFVAHIPDSWADIIFNTTGLDIIVPDVDYGHLTLSFNNGGI